MKIQTNLLLLDSPTFIDPVRANGFANDRWRDYRGRPFTWLKGVLLNL